MHFKALCTDIDGTLLNSKRGLSQRLISAVSRLPKDFPVILASSRMPAAMRHLQHDMDRLGTPMICYNGGYLIHDEAIEGQIMDNVTIPLDFCEKISQLSKNSQIHISIELLQQVGFGVAVANAKKEVLAIADEITASNKEDGVAIMIERYLL